jgi:transcriptional regulator with XRE-family HTH domain
VSSVHGSRRASAFRATRIRRGFTQAQVAERARVHVNTIRKIENGTTREVTKQNAAHFSRILKASIEELGLKVRQPVPRSIRMRQLSVEQRELLDDILSLPAPTLAVVREAVRAIREEQESKHGKKRR